VMASRPTPLQASASNMNAMTPPIIRSNDLL
jgi:hypothetical protein